MMIPEVHCLPSSLLLMLMLLLEMIGWESVRKYGCETTDENGGYCCYCGCDGDGDDANGTSVGVADVCCGSAEAVVAESLKKYWIYLSCSNYGTNCDYGKVNGEWNANV
jgi:hypothetical protein